VARRVFTQDQDQEVARLYISGLSSIKLAKQFGVDKSSILGALKRQGVKRRRSKDEPTIQDRIVGMKDNARFLLAPSEAEQVYKIYQAGYSLPHISMAYGFGKNGRGISAALKRYGYKLRGGKALTEEQEQEVIRLYQEGTSGTPISERFGVVPSVIHRTLNRRNVGRRKHTTVYRYTVKEDIFSQIDNEASAYLLGFIYADGTVNNDKVLRIMISEADRGHLEKMNLLLGSDYPIYMATRNSGYKPESKAVALQINNPRLVRDLADCGLVVGREQFYKTQERIRKDVRNHFIRGYLDGDGCIRGSYNPSVTFVGQPDILAWIRAIFHEELNTNPNLSILKGKGMIHVINYVGINQATLICQWLYKDATVWLQRKRAKFEEWPKPQNKRRLKH
jgi:hypothetical protein